MVLDLIETLFLSEKRENLLLLLLNGPANIKKINSTLDVTSSSILPQIKKLKESGLVHKDDNGSYELTTIGRLIVENMKPLSRMLKVFDESDLYWDERELSSIPDELLNNIGDLGDIELVAPDLDHIYEIPEKLISNTKDSQEMSSILSFFHPDFPRFYADMTNRGVVLDLIVTDSVFERIQNDYEEEMNTILGSENTTFLICKDEAKAPTFNVTEKCAYISFFNNQGRYDHQDIITFEDSAIDWCKKLFSYYRELSRPVSE
ncbi:helix-turn-helix transcriptional regulator [Methanococcoides methylutens]|uniref:helix-turn-helix transcriptional regulator n=1 Tax=Methanococcoides methylutens TaxID=2226 RepID=UPI0040445E2F